MFNFSDLILKCAIFEEHSASCVGYFRFSGTLFPVSMIDGELAIFQHVFKVPIVTLVNVYVDLVVFTHIAGTSQTGSGRYWC